ncbi:DNA phosphorothioation-dependent restriction protein DptG [Mucilaginibacter yixingensis]|uniref:DNA phosphorothioation-dependent restriction protein DptG n=1 Tax=Mucilaginibacter yixingensis TaxID=1295612 RepID=A0A2T5J4B6_9SPHI|nr:hypothetical protein [Mucilaginibacter yixingensis]PTQ92014.1 DNA phosphorothioation-dependent restriction protein DptG [Mucilaginibacter yixingensis]
MSIQKLFVAVGSDFDYLTDHAFSEKNTFLLWRIFLSLFVLQGHNDEALADRATRFIERFHHSYPELFCTDITQDD